MNILFITIAKISNIEERGIYTDLVRKFNKEGHKVFILCPSERKYNEKTSFKTFDKNKILSVWTFNFQKTNSIEKGFSTLLVDYQFKQALQKYLNNETFDICIYTTPPVTFVRTIQYIKTKYKLITYLLLKDIFPQNAVDLNYINKNSLIYNYFRKKEQRLYQISDFIGCLSNANCDFILNNNKFLSSHKLEVNPNTIEITKEIDKDKKQIIEIRKKYNIPQKSLLLFYGGNLGKPQGLEFLISVLKSNIEKNEIFFLIIGDGTEYHKLKLFQKQYLNPNFLILKSVSKKDFDIIIKAADIGLIFLDPRFTIPNIPSRLLTYLENSMPIIAATDKYTDLKSIIESSNCGFWNLSGDIDTFNKHIKAYLDDEKLLIQHGNNARQLIEKEYNISKTYTLIINKVKNGIK